eukprot:TRINITY_DN44686_c0_g1_i2.p1 TRINITY_DN44686_c0_g1~~TRINITY_DN44686_c0_g1_i2.p1  ORF type:complete len:383 (+),score=110.76 TRINITY_DN44686_c0_g1_i2:79-1149(+)
MGDLPAAGAAAGFADAALAYAANAAPDALAAVAAAFVGGWLLRCGVLPVACTAVTLAGGVLLWWAEGGDLSGFCAAHAAALVSTGAALCVQLAGDPRAPALSRWGRGPASAAGCGAAALLCLSVALPLAAPGAPPPPTLLALPPIFVVVVVAVLAAAHRLGPAAEWAPQRLRTADEESIAGLLREIAEGEAEGVALGDLGARYGALCGRSLNRDTQHSAAGDLAGLVSRNKRQFAVVRGNAAGQQQGGGGLRLRARAAPPALSVTSKAKRTPDPTGVSWHCEPAYLRLEVGKQAAAYYTLDGSVPGRTSERYSDRVSLRAPPGEKFHLFKIRAVAVEPRRAPSVLVTADIKVTAKR